MKVKSLIPIALSFLMAGSVFFGCSSKPTTQTPPNTETGDSTGGETGGSTGGETGGDNTGGETGGDAQASTPLPASNKVYVVGDSTVCSFYDKDDYYLRRYGYGTQLAEYLNVTSDQIVNLALSGRSSKSFTYGLDVDSANKNATSGDISCYEYLLNNISQGDYLIIGFGHNDEKSAEPARFTDPNGTIDEENTSKGTSLKWCLNEKYIKVAKEKGATPILCTPIVRYAPDGDYSGSEAHITEDGNYPEAIKQLGEETQTAVIDLTALTKAVYEANNVTAIYYHAHSTYTGDIKTTPYDGTEVPDGIDKTHINKYGAKMVAYQFATALKQTNCSLKNHVKDEISKPTKRIDYVDAINSDYVKKLYVPFAPADYEANKIATTNTGTTSVDWYRTAMGTLGGASKVSLHTATYADDKFSLTAGPGSKFADANDGFGSAFIQISKDDNFTASAHVKVNTVGDVYQAGFGMMLRDDILVDTNDTTLLTNYVSAGLLTVKNASPTAIWSRETATALTMTGNETSCVAGQEYDVSMTRTGQTVVVTFADGTNSFTMTYTDFDFTSRDKEYMYLCLFVSRSFSVEFTNVQFEITGTSQGA
ncbi:MAG: GDSL-type esterase/lipase family protein [Candidatus Coproplasma sp.]